MTDFNFKIVGDASAAGQAIDRVEAGLADIKRQAGEASQNLQGITGRLEGLGKAANFIAGAGAVGGLKSLAEGVESLIHEHEQLQDAYTNLTNVALKFTTTGRTLNVALSAQVELARSLRSEVGPTMELYDGVSDALRNYGLTAKEQADITKVLGQEMIISGKPIGEAAGLIQRLSVALELGAGGGRAFKQIMVEFPELADAAAEAWHTDLTGLIELVDQGKIKIPELTQAWVTHGKVITDEANKRKLTHEQERKLYQQDLGILISEGVEPLQAAFLAGNKEAQDFDRRMREIRSGGKPLADVLGSITADVAEQANKWKVLEENAYNAFTKGMLGAGKDALAGLKPVWDQLASSVGVVGEATSAWNKKHEAELERMRAKAKQMAEEYRRIAFEIGLAGNGGPTRGITQKEQYEQYLRDKEQRLKDEEDAENRSVQYAMEAAEAKIRADEEWRDAVLKATDDAAAKRIKSEQDVADKTREALEQAAKEHEQVQQAIAQGLGSIAADFVNMANEGELSVERLGASLAKLALQIAAMQIGGPWGAALGSFAGGLQLPGHASGTQFMVGGAGGTDQNIVAFRASNNERVTVETQEDQRSGRYFGGGRSGPVVVNMQNDRRDIVQGMNSRDGEVVFVDLERRLRRQRRR